MPVLERVEAAALLGPAARIHRSDCVLGRRRLGGGLALVCGGGIIPVHGCDMIAIRTVLGLQLPIAVVDVRRISALNLQAFGRLVDDQANDLPCFAQMLLERLHIGIETTKQETAVIFETRDLRQVMRTVLVEVLRISSPLRILRLEQLAGVVEGPAVERTGVARLVAALVAANHGATMRARVKEGVELTFSIPRDDDRLAADVAGDVVVVVGDLALVSKIDPVSLPDVLHLQLEQLEVREDVATTAEDAGLGVILDGGFQAFDDLV